MAKFDLREYAREGAARRVAELNAELASIYRVFPDLHRSGAAAGDGSRNRRRRQPMTAAQRKAVAVRMKKYWAERRKAEAKAK